DLGRPASDAALQEYCDKNYHQHLPIIAEKVHQEKVQQERLKAVKRRLNFEETSQHSESGTPSRRRDLKKRLGPRHARSMSESPEPRHGHSESPRKRDSKRKTVFKRLKKGVFHRLGGKGKTLSKSEGSAGGHWKSKPKRQKSSVKDDLSQPWVCEETYPFTPRIRYFDFPKARMPSHIKTYDGSEDPEDHLKIFQTERWAMPTWCHMFNSTLTGNARVWEEFVRRYKLECKDVKGAPECMKISGFMHGITNPELIKRLHDKIPKSVDEMMRWKRPSKCGKKGGNLRKKGKTAGNTDGEEDGTEGPMIIEAEIGGHFVHRISQMIPATTPLVGFSGEIIWPLGQISLLVKIGDEEHSTSAWMNFMVVTSLSPYNGIIGRPGVRRIQAVSSTAHGMLKFPVAGGTVTLQSKEGRKDLCGLLRRNLDMFTWKPADMTGVLRHIAEHRLNIRDGCLPVRQKKRGEAPERNKAIYEEVKKLVDAGIMEEVHYHSWMPNPIMVKKHDGSWRMCVDFKDLNKACPKDGYPLPEIDWKKCTKKSDFQWTAKAETAFKQMKKSIAELPMFTAPKEKEELIIYLAAAKEDVSAVLMTERDGKQMPIYFASRALQGPKINYTPMENHGEEEPLSDPWILFTDGSSCIDVSGAGLIIKNPKGMEFTYALRFRPLQENYVLREIHEGPCSMYSDPRFVVAKALRSGYYWPTMHADAKKLIRESNDCQVHHPVPRNTQQNLTPITSPWPFYKWGIDIAGPFSEGPGKVKFLIVAIDYFTKWIEAKHVATIMGDQIKKFVWENIVCRFGFLGEIISNNEKQLRDNPFKNWCEKLCIRQCFAFVKHPQANGLVERANRSLGEGIKAMLDERSNNWLEEISHVLWAHRTMIMSSNGETSFSLTYGTEAVIPVEIGMPTLKTVEVDMIKNDEALGINLDLLEEKREHVTIQEAKSKAKMEKYYNTSVLNTSFRPGDFVYRNNEASHAKEEGKLGPKWEGPYEVMEALGRGAYKLRGLNESILPRT
nr:reverse transcriptase domain-containing protein [Tanacetum cinerariifolium]